MAALICIYDLDLDLIITHNPLTLTSFSQGRAPTGSKGQGNILNLGDFREFLALSRTQTYPAYPARTQLVPSVPQIWYLIFRTSCTSCTSDLVPQVPQVPHIWYLTIEGTFTNRKNIFCTQSRDLILANQIAGMAQYRPSFAEFVPPDL